MLWWAGARAVRASACAGPTAWAVQTACSGPASMASAGSCTRWGCLLSGETVARRECGFPLMRGRPARPGLLACDARAAAPLMLHGAPARLTPACHHDNKLRRQRSWGWGIPSPVLGVTPAPPAARRW